MNIQTSAQALASLLPSASGQGRGQLQFLATDSPERFARIGGRFLGREIAPEDVTGVDL